MNTPSPLDGSAPSAAAAGSADVNTSSPLDGSAPSAAAAGSADSELLYCQHVHVVLSVLFVHQLAFHESPITLHT